MNLPISIQKLLESHSRYVAKVDRGIITRGGIHRVNSTGSSLSDSRLALVLHVDQDHETTEILLIHTYPELSTSMDINLSANIAGTPYPLVIETEVRGYIWTLQVGDYISTLDAKTMEIINTVAISNPIDDETKSYIGSPLAGPSDPRWSFKLRELKALNRLSSDCISTLLDNETEQRF